MAEKKAGDRFRVLDTHVHLASSELPNTWADTEMYAYCKSLHNGTAVDLKRDTGVLAMHAYGNVVSSLATAIQGVDAEVAGAIFVECGNSPAVEEARWAIKQCRVPGSLFKGVVVHAPVPEGADATRNFLDALRDGADQSLPIELKGARVVLLGNPMPSVEACRSPQYVAGLQELARAGLHWEFCCHHTALPSVAATCRENPDMQFVLDHLGRNGGRADDIEAWKQHILALQNCPNIALKLGAIEEWGCTDPAELLTFVIQNFGFDRVLYESNWFVQACCGWGYSTTFSHIYKACTDCGASSDDLSKVFYENAARIYRLKSTPC